METLYLLGGEELDKKDNFDFISKNEDILLNMKIDIKNIYFVAYIYNIIAKEYNIWNESYDKFEKNICTFLSQNYKEIDAKNLDVRVFLEFVNYENNYSYFYTLSNLYERNQRYLDE